MTEAEQPQQSKENSNQPERPEIPPEMGSIPADKKEIIGDLPLLDDSGEVSNDIRTIITPLSHPPGERDQHMADLVNAAIDNHQMGQDTGIHFMQMFHDATSALGKLVRRGKADHTEDTRPSKPPEI